MPQKPGDDPTKQLFSPSRLGLTKICKSFLRAIFGDLCGCAFICCARLLYYAIHPLSEFSIWVSCSLCGYWEFLDATSVVFPINACFKCNYTLLDTLDLDRGRAARDQNARRRNL